MFLFFSLLSCSIDCSWLVLFLDKLMHRIVAKWNWRDWHETAQLCKVEIGQADMAVGQNQRSHFGVGAPPMLVYFSGWIGMFTGG